jgi:hypothetical protein
MLTRIKRLIVAAGCRIVWIVAALNSCTSAVIIVDSVTGRPSSRRCHR